MRQESSEIVHEVSLSLCNSSRRKNEHSLLVRDHLGLLCLICSISLSLEIFREGSRCHRAFVVGDDTPSELLADCCGRRGKKIAELGSQNYFSQFSSRRLALVCVAGMPPQPSKKRKGNAEGQVVPQPSAVPHRDVLQRLNYLYQSASLLTSALGVPTEGGRRKWDVKQKRKGKGKAKVAEEIGRMDVDVDERLIPTQPPTVQCELSTASESVPLHPLPPPPPATPHNLTVPSSLLPISRMLGRTMREVGTKSTLRMSVKFFFPSCLVHHRCPSFQIGGILGLT